MAKKRVINTILTLKDNFSGGILQAAKNAQKGGANISKSMMDSTRKVVAWKNKFVSSFQDVAKKAAKWGTATAAGLATGFLALDNLTEEYRKADSKVKTAYASMNFSATEAKSAFEGFYRILGDTDTAAEASQLLAALAQDAKDIPTWLHVAAGALGRWGDSLPIEGLIESMNETQRTGTVTGVFADALNWASISEDEFNAKLQATNDLGERNRLIMSTMLKAYNDSAHQFYKNNGAMMDLNSAHLKLQDTMAQLGNSSANVKLKLLQALGLDSSSGQATIREGSFFDLAQIRVERFAEWLDSVDLTQWVDKFDSAVQTGFDKIGGAIDWVKEHGETLIGVLQVLAGLFIAFKTVTFVANLITAGQTIVGFIGTINTMIAAHTGATSATAGLTAAQGGLNAMIAANPFGAFLVVVTAVVLAIAGLYKNCKTFRKWCDAFISGTLNLLIKGFELAKITVGGLIDGIKSLFGFNSKKTISIQTEEESGSSGSTGRNALGTSYWRGGLTRVNERGGEIMRLPSGTQIIPHDISRRAVQSPSVNVAVTVQGNVIGNRAYARQMGEDIAAAIMRKMDNIA